ncbi:MAG: hypothetical protein ACM3XN_06310 [Chloroflexota bacterium]
MSPFAEAARVAAISMPVIFAVMGALWAIIVIMRSLFPDRDEEPDD